MYFWQVYCSFEKNCKLFTHYPYTEIENFAQQMIYSTAIVSILCKKLCSLKKAF